MNYNESLEELFENWEIDFEKAGLNGFCRDGLMYKGKIKYDTRNGTKYYYRESGNENELWHKSNRRIVFLTKDTNGNPNQDMREWRCTQIPDHFDNNHFKNIAYWLYGLAHINKKGEYPKFGTFNNDIDLVHFFDNYPVAIVNCKKESGGSNLSDKLLRQHSSRYSDFLKKQLDILKPNIVYCAGGGSSSVLKIALEIIFNDLEFRSMDSNNWVYSCSQRNLILFNGFHPTAPVKEVEKYTYLMDSFKYFLLNNEFPI